MADIATTVTGLVGGFPYLADTLVNLPAAHIARPAFDPRMVMSKAKATYQFQFIVYAPRSLDKQTQVLLDTFCEPTGATSVTAAIEDEDNWGTVTVDYASVTNIGTVQPTEVAGVPYFVVVFDVEVCW